jgi:hypothetical protein
VAFQGRFWGWTGGGGSVGRLTHCGDAAADWREALASMRLDDEEIDRGVEEVEAMTAVANPLRSLYCLSRENSTRESKRGNGSNMVKLIYLLIFIYLFILWV